MPSQQQIERFTLAFHQVAVDRLRQQPALKQRALEVLSRWESSGVSSAGQRYRDTWRRLLTGDIEALTRAVCTDTEQAATLRSMSPLGFLLPEDERLRIRREAMAA
jgi:hypothetical protein